MLGNEEWKQKEIQRLYGEIVDIIQAKQDFPAILKWNADSSQCSFDLTKASEAVLRNLDYQNKGKYIDFKFNQATAVKKLDMLLRLLGAFTEKVEIRGQSEVVDRLTRTVGRMKTYAEN